MSFFPVVAAAAVAVVTTSLKLSFMWIKSLFNWQQKEKCIDTDRPVNIMREKCVAAKGKKWEEFIKNAYQKSNKLKIINASSKRSK